MAPEDIPGSSCVFPPSGPFKLSPKYMERHCTLYIVSKISQLQIIFCLDYLYAVGGVCLKSRFPELGLLVRKQEWVWVDIYFIYRCIDTYTDIGIYTFQ